MFANSASSCWHFCYSLEAAVTRDFSAAIHLTQEKAGFLINSHLKLLRVILRLWCPVHHLQFLWSFVCSLCYGPQDFPRFSILPRVPCLNTGNLPLISLLWEMCHSQDYSNQQHLLLSTVKQSAPGSVQSDAPGSVRCRQMCGRSLSYSLLLRWRKDPVYSSYPHSIPSQSSPALGSFTFFYENKFNCHCTWYCFGCV